VAETPDENEREGKTNMRNEDRAPTLLERGRWTWVDFSVDGERYRRPLRNRKGKRIPWNPDPASDDYKSAIRAAELLRRDAQDGKLAPRQSKSFACLTLAEALDRHLRERKPYLSANSIATEAQLAKNLKRGFAGKRLSQISSDGIREYVARRSAGELFLRKSAASPRAINMEVGLLRRLLKRAKRLHLLANEIKPLPERHDIGRAMTLDEKLRLTKTAGFRPGWENARLAMTLALNTTMRSGEIKGLRWRDVDLMDACVTVRRSSTKTDAGERVIPLNPDAMQAMRELRERSMRLFGEVSPDWYLFFRSKALETPDPTRPIRGWRAAWMALKKAAGIDGLRFHDLRHHCITELAEEETPDQVIKSIAGHVSQKMLEHYSHIRLQAKRRALDGLSQGRHGTKRGTLPADAAAETTPANVFNSLDGADEQESACDNIMREHESRDSHSEGAST
jgi:integrase